MLETLLRNSVDKRTLSKIWVWPKILRKIKSCFPMAALNSFLVLFTDYWYVLSFLKNILSFLECQYSLSLRLFQIVHFQYFHNDTAEPPTPAISLLFATVEPQSIHDYSRRWVLRTGLERERAERFSEWRKTFRITVHFSSNKMLVRST